MPKARLSLHVSDGRAIAHDLLQMIGMVGDLGQSMAEIREESRLGVAELGGSVFLSMQVDSLRTGGIGLICEGQ